MIKVSGVDTFITTNLSHETQLKGYVMFLKGSRYVQISFFYIKNAPDNSSEAF